MAFYPLMVDLSDKKVIVIGGGPVAERKLRGLIQADPVIVVISPQVTNAIHSWISSGRVSWEKRHYEAGDLKEAFLAILASGDEEAEQTARAEAVSFGTLLVSSQDGSKGDTMMTSYFRRGHLVVSVSTEGTAPKLAAKLRREIERPFGTDWIEYLDILCHIRGRARPYGREAMQQIMGRVDDLPLLEWVAQHKHSEIVSALDEIFDPYGRQFEDLATNENRK